TARKKAEHARALIESDIDPINEKKRLKNEYAKSLNTIGMIASLAYEAKKAELEAHIRDLADQRCDRPVMI
ncbi:MAG: hypothetical protein EBS81_12795, partial [Gammaproteobacteria bacterium]|nr:hypothetical protein [Gammaproteobacteria bacterium]